MSLIQELIHLNLNNLKIQYLNSGERSYSFVLKTAAGKLVAIGWHVADHYNEKDYSFKDKKSNLLANYNSPGSLTFHEWFTWPGDLFLINNRSIWHCSFNMSEPIGFIHNSLDLFVKNMKFNFIELRTESEIAAEEIRMLYAEKEQLQNTDLLKSVKIIKLQAEIKQLSHENSQLKKMIKRLEEGHSLGSVSL